MNEFFQMGGYAAYVWSAYGLSAVVLGLSLLLPIIEKKKIHKRITQMHEQEEN